MIYFEKSQPAPDCLAKEKLKEEDKEKGLRKTGGKPNCNCKCVENQLAKDFEGKCYICEGKNFTSPVVEHFKPHRDKNIKVYAQLR